MKESQESFDMLGVKIKDSNGKIKDSTVLFYEVSDALKKLDKSQQLAYGRKFRLDPTIITTMTSDIAALQAQYDSFAAAAGVDLETAAQASSDLMDEIGKFGKLSQMVMRSVMTGFILKLKDSFIALRKWLLEHADTVKKTIQKILSFIERMANALGSTFARFGMIFSRLSDWWGTLDEKTQKLILSVLGLAAAFKLFNLQWLMSPIGMVVAALTALFLIWDDLMTYMEGGETLIDWGPWMDDIQEAAATLQVIWDKLKEFVAWVWERLDFTDIWEGLKTQLAGVKDAFLGAFDFLKGIFSGDWFEAEAGVEKLWNGIITFFEGKGQVLLGVVKNILKLIGDAFGLDLSGLISILENVFGKLVDTARSLVEPFKNVIFGAIDSIAALFRGDFSGAIEAAGSVVKSVFGAIETVVLGVLDVIKDLVNFVLSGLGIDATGVFNALKSVAEVVFGAIDKVIDGVVGTIKGLIGWAKELWGWFSKLWGGGEKTEEQLEKEKDDLEYKALREKHTTWDTTGSGYTDEKAVEKDWAKYQAAKAEQKSLKAESGESPQSAASAPDGTKPVLPPLDAKNVTPESPPLMTESTRAGNIETKNTTNQQINNVNTNANITINGSGDPEETAERTVVKLDDATRLIPPAITSMTGPL
jgi:hypothetical protein